MAKDYQKTAPQVALEASKTGTVKPAAKLTPRETIYVGIDVHKKNWHVTLRTAEVELQSASIPSTWEALQKMLLPFKKHRIEAVYEAGHFGFWLHDELQNWGAHGTVTRTVTPPSLVPQEQGNRVKTDKRDSHKLAHYLAKGLLKEVYVPTPEERSHRQVIRRRRQLIRARKSVQCQIKGAVPDQGLAALLQHPGV